LGDLTEDVLKLIQSSEDGILQSDLWKAVGIDSRKCSRIVGSLLKSGLITREPVVSNGTRTFLVKYVDKKIDTEKYSYLFSGKLFSPCTGCSIECEPPGCAYLTMWIQNLL